MNENQQQVAQYIAGLKSQLTQMKGRLDSLERTPAFVRVRKGLDVEYQNIKSQYKALSEKVKIARTRADEMLAMEEAQGAGARVGGALQKNIKIAIIGSGLLLVSIVIGAIIYKKVKKK